MKIGYFVQTREGTAMGKLPRKTVKRLWYCGFLVLWLLPFALGAIAAADGALVTAESTGQGWYWRSRPPYAIPETGVPGQPGTGVGGDAYCYQAPGSSPCAAQWAQEHLYVGWDGQELTAEMVSAINFDLEPIPSGSTITRFILTLKQHPGHTHHNASTTQPPHNNTPNYDAAANHGVVACPWPEFFGGEHAAPLLEEYKEQRLCGDAISGVSSNKDVQYMADVRNTVDWTFDLSSIASEWAAGTNPAISIEPDPRSKSPISWITTFHFDTVFHDPSSGHVTSPNAPAGHRPGISAEVTYLLGTGEEQTGLISGEFGSGLEGTDDSLSFGDTSGLAGDLGASAEPPTPTEPAPQLAAGTFEGKPAGFWAYPIAWVAALLGFLLLGFAGKILQADPGEPRPPGAAAALMRGTARGA